MIELNGLFKSFGKVPALEDIHLSISSGEIFGIIGRSGAGKSTLLHCINLLEIPDRGQVIVDDKNLTSLSIKELRKTRYKIGMIFQHFNLLDSQTVYENVALPMRIQGICETEIKNKVQELLTLVELEKKMSVYPSQLSGGQKQRVAIARALSCSPKILLCDEATSSLDPTTTQSILDLLKKINTLYGITIVLITHEMQVVKQICQRFAVMEAGRIIETNSLKNVLNQEGSIARNMLFAQLSPQLPTCLSSQLTSIPNNKPLLRLLFQGQNATVPFISQTSRDLNIDINILLANLDRFEGITCGVLIVELNADKELLSYFIKRCEAFKLTVEILGYVTSHVL